MGKREYILILAGGAKEASTYAKRMNFRSGEYRAVSKASSIRGIQSAVCHVLPAFHNRLDRHAILKELKFARNVTFKSVEMPEPAVVDVGDGMGEQMSLWDVLSPALERDEHYATTGSFEPPSEMGGPRGQEESRRPDVPSFEAPPKTARRHRSVDPEVEVVAKEPGRRRKRCKQCGAMTFADYANDPTGHLKEHH